MVITGTISNVNKYKCTRMFNMVSYLPKTKMCCPGINQIFPSDPKIYPHAIVSYQGIPLTILTHHHRTLSATLLLNWWKLDCLDSAITCFAFTMWYHILTKIVMAAFDSIWGIWLRCWYTYNNLMVISFKSICERLLMIGTDKYGTIYVMFEWPSVREIKTIVNSYACGRCDLVLLYAICY